VFRFPPQPHGHSLASFARQFRGDHRLLIPGYWLVCTSALLIGVAMAAFYAPVDDSMGAPHRILYIHLPAALNMFAGCAIVFASSVAFLWQRSLNWDDIAAAAAEVTVVLGGIVIGTGMLWAWLAWGTVWTWSPRLTLSLVIWLLYAGYLLLRRTIRDEQRRALACSLYALIAFLNVPLFYLSITVFSDVHPSDSRLNPEMRLTLAFWIVPVTMLCAGATCLRLTRPLTAAQGGRTAPANPR